MRGSSRALRVARAGWLVALSLVAGAAAILALDRGSPGGPPAAPQPPGPPGQVVLLVLDGVRADDAGSPARMPALVALAASGTAWRARVDAVVPSTVAGIRALVEGRTAPPASFLSDFGARAARDGGLLEAARAAGRRVFVAGPHLWTDLYGRFVDEAVVVETVGADDARLVAAALDAVASRQFDLVVAHLGATDDAAHLHGARSPVYVDALRRADDVVARVRAALGPGTRLIVTSDHGLTDAGGHAGTEVDVVTVPVITSPAWPGVSARRQVDVPALARAALGLEPGAAVTRAAPASVALPLGSTLVVVAGGVLVLARSPSSARARRVVPLIAVFAGSTALAVLGAAPVAGWTAALGVVVVAVIGRRGEPAAPRTRGLALSALVGGALALARLVDGADGGRAAPAWIAAAALVALTAGAWLGGRSRSPLTGAALVTVVVALTRLLGEGASLSTIDVRAAFALVDGALGVPGAVTAVLLRHGLLGGACALGLAWSLRAARPRPLDDALRGATAAWLAHALVFAATYGLGASAAHEGSWEAAQRLRALGLGGLVRLALEGTAFYLALGAGVALLQRRASQSKTTTATESGSTRPTAEPTR